jgi:hypothetical protein
MTLEGLKACIYAFGSSLVPITCALYKAYTPHDAQHAAPHADVRVSEITP